MLVSATVRHMFDFDVEKLLTFPKSLFIENRGPLHGGGVGYYPMKLKKIGKGEVTASLSETNLKLNECTRFRIIMF